MTAREYAAWLRTPFLDEHLAGDDAIDLVVVRPGRSGAPASILAPGSLPVVVAIIGDDFGDPGPDGADLVVGIGDVDDVATAISRAPLAATAVAMLLRSARHDDVDAGLVAESATYSMLQAGPEFAAWRAGRAPRPDEHHTTDDAVVTTERRGDEWYVTLDRPDRHNAISTRLRDELADALQFALVDTSVERVVLSGAGPSFCSGGDLDEFGSRRDPVTAHRTRLARSPGRLIHQLGNVTSELHGAALGGGIELAAFGRRVIADPDTRIGLPEIGLGLIPGAGGTVSLLRRIGRQRTAALALTGRTIDTSTALRWGLVDEIRPRRRP